MADAPWTARETVRLLGVINALDPRFRLDDEAETLVKAEVYAGMLTTNGVPLEWPERFARRYYTMERDRPLQVGMIIQAWKSEERVAAAKAPVDEVEETLARNAPPWFHQYRQDCQEAADATGSTDPLIRRAAIEAVPRPPVRDTGLVGTHGRDCGIAGCACSHTRCRGGWLDVEGVKRQHGQDYAVVRRCVTCNDAVLMREEEQAQAATQRRRQRYS